MRRRTVSRLLRLLRRHPALFALVSLALAAGYAHEVWVARPAMAWQGLPTAMDWSPARWTRVLRNDGFLVGYSEWRANPLWVTYRVDPLPADATAGPRPERFEADWRSLRGVGHEDYTGSGYDRGHLAPNALIARLYGRAAQLASFRMSNIVPQAPSLNQKWWQRLEQLEATRFGNRFERLWVVTGPVFDERVERLRSGVEIPDAFFKVFAAPGERPQLLAFLVPQQVRGGEPLERFVVSVDAVEAATGLDLFPQLAPEQAARLEATVEPGSWGLPELRRRP